MSDNARPYESSAEMIAKWRDEHLCVRCERPLSEPGPCQPKNLPSRPTHRSVADLLGKGSEEPNGPHRVIGEFSGDPSCAVCHHSWPCPTAKGSGEPT